MSQPIRVLVLVVVMASHVQAWPPNNCTGYPDIRTVQPDLTNPVMVNDTNPGPGVRVRETTPQWAHTQVYHAIMLPSSWKPKGSYPVLVEFAGNGPWKSQYGDVSTGRPEGSKLGFGIDTASSAIWISMPFLTADLGANTSIQTYWWGCGTMSPPSGHCSPSFNYDITPTLNYTQDTLTYVSETYGADLSRVLLLGFSRGAIAAGYLGLHNDDMAKLWKGFVAYTHYDGLQRWPYPDSDPASALIRLKRIGDRPSYLVSECTFAIDTEQAYINATGIRGTGAPFTFRSNGFRNHNDAWVLRPSPARDALRAWVSQQLSMKGD